MHRGWLLHAVSVSESEDWARAQRWLMRAWERCICDVMEKFSYMPSLQVL
jgi:hypothetical protein